jgi:hypothetical protein
MIVADNCASEKEKSASGGDYGCRLDGFAEEKGCLTNWESAEFGHVQIVAIGTGSN